MCSQRLLRRVSENHKRQAQLKLGFGVTLANLTLFPTGGEGEAPPLHMKHDYFFVTLKIWLCGNFCGGRPLHPP